MTVPEKPPAKYHPHPIYYKSGKNAGQFHLYGVDKRPDIKKFINEYMKELRPGERRKQKFFHNKVGIPYWRVSQIINGMWSSYYEEDLTKLMAFIAKVEGKIINVA